MVFIGSQVRAFRNGPIVVPGVSARRSSNTGEVCLEANFQTRLSWFESLLGASSQGYNPTFLTGISRVNPLPTGVSSPYLSKWDEPPSVDVDDQSSTMGIHVKQREFLVEKPENDL